MFAKVIWISGITETDSTKSSLKASAMPIKKVINKRKIDDQPKDIIYWRTKTFSDRLEALEEIRQEYNSWRYGAQQGFHRVYRIVKRA